MFEFLAPGGSDAENIAVQFVNRGRIGAGTPPPGTERTRNNPRLIVQCFLTPKQLHQQVFPIS